MQAKYQCDALIAENKRSYELKQAEFNQEVNRSKAEAELAYELQAAKVRSIHSKIGAYYLPESPKSSQGPSRQQETNY